MATGNKSEDAFAAFLADIEQRRLPEARALLEKLESGQMQTGERTYGAPSWVDTTPRNIERLRAEVAEYERVAELVRNRQAT